VVIQKWQKDWDECTKAARTHARAHARTRARARTHTHRGFAVNTRLYKFCTDSALNCWN